MEKEAADAKRMNILSWKRRILVEVVARSFRRIVDKKLFHFSSDPDCSMRDSDVKKIIATCFNAALWGGDELHELIWAKINEWKKECFPTLKSSDGRDVEVSIRDVLVDGCGYLLESFLWISSNLLGVKWTLALWNNRDKPEYFQNMDRHPVDFVHVRDVQPRVLELSMAHYAHGVALSEYSREDREANLEAIIRSFQNALDRQPTDVRTMDRLASSYRALASQLESTNSACDRATEERISILRLKAEYLVEMAEKVRAQN